MVCVPKRTGEIVHMIHNHLDSQTLTYKLAVLDYFT